MQYQYIVTAIDVNGRQYLVGQYQTMSQAVEAANSYRIIYDNRVTQIKSAKEVK